jgi:hypothetical protein
VAILRPVTLLTFGVPKRREVDMLRAIAVIAVLLLCGGCATGPSKSELFVSTGDAALARGDDKKAFENFAWAIDSENQKARQTALERLRASPRLQAAMESVLRDLQVETAMRNDYRAAYLPAYGRRSEVRAYVAFKGFTQEEQQRYLDATWEDISPRIEGLRAERRAAEKRLEDAAAEEKAREAAALAALIAAAERGSRVVCTADSECRKAFALAQIYVSTKTDMKIQLATDTIIETYNPTEGGRMGAKVIKTPGAGQSAEIVITVSCRECSLELRKISYQLMSEFRPFVESRLRQ